MRCTRRSHPWNHRQTRSPRVRALRDVCQKSDREIGICLCSACRLGLCCNAAPTIDNLIAGPCVKDWSTSHAERVGRPGPWPPPWAQGIAPLQPWRARAARRSGVPTRLRRVARRRRPASTAVRIPRRMARHSSGRRVVAASVPTASAPAPSALAAEYQPGYDGLPGGAQGLRALPSYRLRSGLCWVRRSYYEKATSNSRKTTTMSLS